MDEDVDFQSRNKNVSYALVLAFFATEMLVQQPDMPIKDWNFCDFDLHKMSQIMRRRVLCQMRTTKLQISLRIRAV